MNRYIDLTLISLIFVMLLSISMSAFADFEPALLPAELVQNLDLNSDGINSNAERHMSRGIMNGIDRRR